MKKLAKRISSILAAAITITSIAVSVSADCSHGNYQTVPYGPTYEYKELHHHQAYGPNSDPDSSVFCTITTRTRLIRTICGYCGTVVDESMQTVYVNHSYKGGPAKPGSVDHEETI